MNKKLLCGIGLWLGMQLTAVAQVKRQAERFSLAGIWKFKLDAFSPVFKATVCK
jgi:hypothetical protein